MSTTNNSEPSTAGITTAPRQSGEALDSSSSGAGESGRSWLRFSVWFAGAAAVTAASLYGFTVAMDPYGIFASPDRPAAPMMDVNQRFMYPQVVRSGRFDSAVFGTSTVRLLDPERLDAGLGGKFANLAMNAATPWEQTQLAGLFLLHTPAARSVIFGLDSTWCDGDADSKAKRLTFRSFPPWLYDEARAFDLLHMFDFQSLEIATRVAANRFGMSTDRIRADGYEVFTPPENLYDLARARTHIWAEKPDVTPVEPPEQPTAAQQASWRFPATAWLEGLLKQASADASGGPRVALVFPPVHIAAQPRAGSVEAARQNACKAAFTELGARYGATVMDFRFPNPVTSHDENYWDNLHYRLPIASKLTSAVIGGLRREPVADPDFTRVPAVNSGTGQRTDRDAEKTDDVNG